MQIQDRNPIKMLPLLQSGFRPFFLGAIIFAITAMMVWTSELYFHWQIPLQTISRAQWHGHEMIFGYTFAVISGFLLTAVQNWTGQKTCNGKTLLVLFLFWVLTHVLGFYPYADSMPVIWISSLLFYVTLISVLTRTLLKTHNNKQWGVIGKLVLLAGLDMWFLSIAAGWLPNGPASTVLLLSVFTVVGLIFVMGARVIPGFTKNAISHAENIKDWPQLGYVSLLLYLCFVASDIFHWQVVLVISGVTLTILNVVRLWGWYDHEIWKKPLVWVLHVAIAFITLGIFTYSLGRYLHIMPHLSLHMMTYGGITMITAGMIARVSLGHTGRSVFEPPEDLVWVFILIGAGAVCRSIFPIFWMDYYFYWILIAQFFWIGAFVLMLGFYFKPLVSARRDGRFG